MGVPAFFRWLSQKYPKIISPVLEERPEEVDGQEIPVDTTKENPNGEEFDNLYLDMNGIVHPCSHPEDRPAPETEAEMMLEVFRYTERVVAMVRPRKILMIAVDGVAPRAKMNQQRSRRFRSAQEVKEKEEKVAEFVKLLATKGTTVEDGVSKKTWDSNAITPGTPFMDILSLALKYWTAYKLNTDPAWEKLKIIISDATVPGEGEHKIMEFVRSQRVSPDHDPNTRHVIYGLDADLIMLGLATHEPHFRVLREDVFAQDSKPRLCAICNQKGHRAEECTGQAKEKEGEFDEKSKAQSLKPFIWLHVDILREYLEIELKVPGMPFDFDLERAIDDWVFLCFFVGNDFLPHLPSLEIRDEGIATLTAIWRDNLAVMGGYITRDGTVDIARAQFILDGLARQEDAIFRKRRQIEERRAENAKRRKLQNQGSREGAADSPTPMYRGKGERPITEFPSNIPMFAPNDKSDATRQLSHNAVVNRADIRNANVANKSAAAALKNQLLSKTITDDVSTSNDPSSESSENTPGTVGKRKADVLDANSTPQTPGTPAEGNENPDTVKLWEPGYRDRYYEQKFQKSPDDTEFRHQVARSYVEGLCWVLLYYYQGCASWTWYYPYHYAPFAQDFKNMSDMDINFSLGKPFKPFEQLMGVLPAASSHTLPAPFKKLMTDDDSEIIDFYPEDFPVDLNGKKFAWQGVVILPFIDEKRLLAAVQKIYPVLTPEELSRNEMGTELLLFSDGHPLYDELASQFFSKRATAEVVDLDSRISEGLVGQVKKYGTFLPHSSLKFPMSIENTKYGDLDDDRSMMVSFELKKANTPHKSMLLRGVVFKTPALNSTDQETLLRKQNSSGRSYGGGRLHDDRGYNNGFPRRGGMVSYAPPPGVRGPTIQPPYPGGFSSQGNFPPFPPPPVPSAQHGYQSQQQQQTHNNGGNFSYGYPSQFLPTTTSQGGGYHQSQAYYSGGPAGGNRHDNTGAGYHYNNNNNRGGYDNNNGGRGDRYGGGGSRGGYDNNRGSRDNYGGGGSRDNYGGSYNGRGGPRGGYNGARGGYRDDNGGGNSRGGHGGYQNSSSSHGRRDNNPYGRK